MQKKKLPKTECEPLAPMALAMGLVQARRAMSGSADHGHFVPKTPLPWFVFGFSETSSFTTTFRKHAGLTPTAYRRSLE
jgi:methylphosphotriester-DNA--protein-cysteine methyltransferase